MFDIFQTIVASVTSFFIIVVSPLSNALIPTPTPTQAPEQTNTITASGSYSYQGYSINMSIEFPKSGGNVSGKIEGDCNGDIKGMYANDTRIIEGKAGGTCSVLFLQVNAQADLDGKVLLDQKQIEMSFVGKAEDFTHTDKLTLTFK